MGARTLHAVTLPIGTVTFLLADVEGSTRLVQQAGPVYAELLADTRRIIRESVTAHGGAEVDAHGDELLSVFGDAEAGASAALAAQRQLIAHDWPGGYSVRVRIGVHTGEPLVTEDGYTGIDVHRVARVASAGHGGQILLTEPTKACVPAFATADLGTHRFPGLGEPERVYQIVAEGLPRDFPALRDTVSSLGNAMRVVLADDSVLLREGVARLLEEAGFEVAG